MTTPHQNRQAPGTGAATPQTYSRGRLNKVREYRWVIGVWAVVAIFAIITAAWSYHVGVPLRDPEGRIFRKRLTWALILSVILALVDAIVRTGRSGWTVRKAATELRRRWPKERLALVLTGLLAYHIVYVCYRNLKSWVAFQDVNDEQLLKVDRWLFFGHSPAVMLHDLLGQDLATHVMAALYGAFTYMVPIALVGSLVFTTRIRDGYVFLTSAIWVWILGVGSYYLIPALGPFASAPEEFAHLPRTGIATTQAKYLAERAHFLHDPSAHDSFVSISAFASLHIGFTFMVVLMLRYYGLRRATQVMAVYLVTILFATIYLGWHFVVDDVAGLVLAALAVFLGSWMTYPRGRRSPEAKSD